MVGPVIHGSVIATIRELAWCMTRVRDRTKTRDSIGLTSNRFLSLTDLQLYIIQTEVSMESARNYQQVVQILCRNIRTTCPGE